MRRLTLLTLVLAAVLGILAHKEAPLIISPADRTLMDNVLFDFVKRNGDNCSEKQNKFKDESGKTQLCHTLNNTCVAPPRMLIAFLENNLQADGTVVIPEVLRPYMGGTEKLVPTAK